MVSRQKGRQLEATRHLPTMLRLLALGSNTCFVDRISTAMAHRHLGMGDLTSILASHTMALPQCMDLHFMGPLFIPDICLITIMGLRCIVRLCRIQATVVPLLATFSKFVAPLRQGNMIHTVLGDHIIMPVVMKERLLMALVLVVHLHLTAVAVLETRLHLVRSICLMLHH